MNCGPNVRLNPTKIEQRRELAERVVVHAAGHLRPPVVQAGEVAHDRAADHDVVEVRDDEVGVVQVDVEAERRQEQSGQAAHEEQAQEAEDEHHRRLPPDRALVERRRPVERLDRGRNRDRERQEREDQRRVGRDAGHEQVVRPDEEAEHRDRQARERDERVAEDVLAREAGDDLADHAHRRQDHDVDRRVRVEPEQVLEEHRVAAERAGRRCRSAGRARATSISSVIAMTGVPSTCTRLVA